MLAELLAGVATAETSCALVRKWKARVLQQVAAKIDGAFHWNSAASSASVSDMVEEGHGFTSLRSRKRRRRLDSDILLGRMAKSMRLKRFGSGSQASRAGDIDCASSSARDAEQEHCVRYMQATESIFTGQTQVSVAFDESCVNEATMSTALYSHRTKTAAWLLPMVPRSSVYLGVERSAATKNDRKSNSDKK